MKIRLATLLAALCLSSLAFAANQADPSPDAPGMRRVKYSGSAGTAVCQNNAACKVLSHVGGAGGDAAHTMVFRTIGYATLEVQINFTRVAGTALMLTWYCSKDMGTTYGQMSSQAISSGAATLNPFVQTWTTSTTGNYTFPGVDVRRCDMAKAVLAVTGGGSSDYVDTEAIASVGE